jgi:hypothetical protein
MSRGETPESGLTAIPVAERPAPSSVENDEAGSWAAGGGNAATARRLEAGGPGSPRVAPAAVSRLVASGGGSNAAVARLLARDAAATQAPPAGSAGAAEAKEKPGPALRVNFGDKDYPFDVKWGAAVSKDASAKISKELGASKQFPLSPGIVGNFGLTGEVGIEAKTSISGSVSRTETMAPTASGKTAYIDTFDLTGTASLEAFVKGGVKVGVGVGWPGASVTGNLTGGLGASGSTSVALKGSATRLAVPEDDQFNEWSGSIAMPVSMGIKLEAAVGGSIDFAVLFAEGSLAQWEFAKWTIAEGTIACTSSVGIPGGLVADDVAIKGLTFNPPPTLAPVKTEGSPPWGEGSGVSGAGPGSAPAPPEEPAR